MVLGVVGAAEVVETIGMAGEVEADGGSREGGGDSCDDVMELFDGGEWICPEVEVGPADCGWEACVPGEDGLGQGS